MKKGIKRGCGTRVPGGAYVCVDLSPEGIPIDEFLYDPPKKPIDAQGNVHYPGAVGLHLMQDVFDDDLYHLWDWIGTNYYPFFPDFWEETRRFGLSRRISSNANFDGLQYGKSKIVGFHALGILEGTERFYERLAEEWVVDTSFDAYQCKHDHAEKNKFCVKNLWQLVDNQKGDNERLHEVSLPRSDGSTGSYKAASIPSWINRYKTEWVPAAMFVLPIHRVEVIEDPLEGKHEQTIEKIEKSITNLPVYVVQQ
ncbi:MAG: hypothetical protein ACP5D6_06380 [Kosmotogaceae bacterium]